MAQGKTHIPTKETKAQVAALYSFGNTQEEIASYFNICVDTLFKHYKDELRKARIDANATVANKLYNKAVNQDDLGAQIFWLKTQARWRTQDIESVNDQNERLRKELDALKIKLDAKNKKDY